MYSPSSAAAIPNSDDRETPDAAIQSAPLIRHASTASATDGPQSPSVTSTPRSTIASKGKRTSNERVHFQQFRDICGAMVHEVARIEECLSGSRDPSFHLVTFEQLLDQLFECEWGQEESLARIAVAIESQVKNVEWSARHVSFLREFLAYLSTRYMVDAAVVDFCLDCIRSHGLDPFRGTLTDTDSVKQYRIVEASDESQG